MKRLIPIAIGSAYSSSFLNDDLKRCIYVSYRAKGAQNQLWQHVPLICEMRKENAMYGLIRQAIQDLGHDVSTQMLKAFIEKNFPQFAIKRSKKLLKRAKNTIFHITQLSMCKREAAKKRKICGINTQNKYKDWLSWYLVWHEDQGFDQGDAGRLDDLLKFIQLASEYLSQSTLNSLRSALKKIFNKSLPFVSSNLSQRKVDRAYSREEIDLILSKMKPKESLSIRLLLDTGMRVHELARMFPLGVGEKSSSREWTDLRFLGRENFVVIVVKGKNGLLREIAISFNLWEELMDFKRDVPVQVLDGKISYRQWFAVPFGQKLAAKFSRIANKVLGFSHGIHGLRHSYAQSRAMTLKNLGVDDVEAMVIVSQELGHFRPRITLTYMRGQCVEAIANEFKKVRLKTVEANTRCRETVKKLGLSAMKAGKKYWGLWGVSIWPQNDLRCYRVHLSQKYH